MSGLWWSHGTCAAFPKQSEDNLWLTEPRHCWLHCANVRAQSGPALPARQRLAIALCTSAAAAAVSERWRMRGLAVINTSREPPASRKKYTTPLVNHSLLWNSLLKLSLNNCNKQKKSSHHNVSVPVSQLWIDILFFSTSCSKPNTQLVHCNRRLRRYT